MKTAQVYDGKYRAITDVRDYSYLDQYNPLNTKVSTTFHVWKNPDSLLVEIRDTFKSRYTEKTFMLTRKEAQELKEFLNQYDFTEE